MGRRRGSTRRLFVRSTQTLTRGRGPLFGDYRQRLVTQPLLESQILSFRAHRSGSSRQRAYLIHGRAPLSDHGGAKPQEPGHGGRGRKLSTHANQNPRVRGRCVTQGLCRCRTFAHEFAPLWLLITFGSVGWAMGGCAFTVAARQENPCMGFPERLRSRNLQGSLGGAALATRVGFTSAIARVHRV